MSAISAAAGQARRRTHLLAATCLAPLVLTSCARSDEDATSRASLAGALEESFGLTVEEAGCLSHSILDATGVTFYDPESGDSSTETRAGDGGLASLDPTADPARLTDEVDRALVRCLASDRPTELHLDAAVADDVLDRPLADCVARELDGHVSRRILAINLVYGGNVELPDHEFGLQTAAIGLCGLPTLVASTLGSVASPATTECFLERQRSLYDAVQDRPEAWADLLGEASASAVAVYCWRTLRPASPLGDQTMAAVVDAFVTALATELAAPRGPTDVTPRQSRLPVWPRRSSG